MFDNPFTFWKWVNPWISTALPSTPKYNLSQLQTWRFPNANSQRSRPQSSYYPIRSAFSGTFHPPRNRSQLLRPPCFGLRWDAQIVRRINSKRLCDALWSLRNSKLDKTNYQRIVSFWGESQKSEPSFPAAWGEWRSLIENTT